MPARVALFSVAGPSANRKDADTMAVRQAAVGPREQLLSGVPVEERQLVLAGISTALLEGGEGPPLVLLHGPAGNATHWAQVIPGLVTTRRVIAPDLPGHGASEAGAEPLDADRLLAWLGELIERACPSPPALVGHAAAGAMAARFAADHDARVARLVLVDTLGLSTFDPVPAFGKALNDFLAQPGDHTHDNAWRYCAYDLAALRARMGGRWDAFRAYNLDRARTRSLQSALAVLMGEFGMPAIPAAKLHAITAPTTLIWGRHDLATPLHVAQAVGGRYGWPVKVIDDCADDPPVERPEALCDALRSTLDEREAA
jgi:pimeloyl-ACP methyl ester carboxylesterase